MEGVEGRRADPTLSILDCGRLFAERSIRAMGLISPRGGAGGHAVRILFRVGARITSHSIQLSQAVAHTLPL